MKIIRCTHCNAPLIEAEENTIIVKTCPECKVQNRIKVEADNIIGYNSYATQYKGSIKL